MKAIIEQSKLLLFFVVMTVCCLVILWFSANNQLHSSTIRGSVVEHIVGTGGYNSLYLYFAVCGLIVCAVGLPVTLVVTLKTVFSQAARATRKAIRKADWERKQALEAEVKAPDAP